MAGQKVVAVLLQLGADVHAQIHGNTAGERDINMAGLALKRVDVARALIDCGARLDRVQCPMPAWVPPFVAAREWCRYAALLLLGIWRLRRSAVLGDNNRDAIRLVVRAVWQSRTDPGWERCLEPPAKK